MSKNEIKITVRDLVEFIFRSGDLNNDFVFSSRTVDGIKAHQKIQKSKDYNYRSEVSLSYSVEIDNICITVEGRADGIILEDEAVIIDEIKSTAIPLDQITQSTVLHRMQAMLYAYIYSAENDILDVFVQVTYINIDTNEKKSIKDPYSFNELEDFFLDTVKKYIAIADITDWNITRNASIKNLKFPFDSYRKDQRKLVVGTYNSIIKNKNLFVQAPTGTGKTISTIFPSVMAIPQINISKIFYLTAKTMTRQAAEKAFDLLRNKGLKIKTLTLTAKDKICFKETSNCDPEYCEYAKGHFDRINDALLDILNNEDYINREKVEEYACRNKVCPFEFSLDLALFVDAVICDYNYVFDPRIALKRFFSHCKGNYVFLIDEAHNLVNRSREMFSAELYKSSFLSLNKVFKSKEPKISKALSKINSYMVKLRKKCNGKTLIVLDQEVSDLYTMLNDFIERSEKWLLKNRNTEGFEQLLQLFFDAISFIRISEFYDNKYVTYVETKKNEVKVKLFCLDPSYLLSEVIKKGISAIFFSATLTPLDYFREILGGNKEDDITFSLSSPFDEKKFCLLVADNISTKFSNRDDSYDKIVELIKATVEQKVGNYMIYFPSYKYMNEVYSRFTVLYPDIHVISQEIAMTEENREVFLNRFQSTAADTFIAYGVLGGIFSESIDLLGNRLIGSVIIGVGLPQINPEEDIIRNYFQSKNRMGYEYAYMYPGMNKVLQAAGRVIRSETDEGIVILVDERFSQGNYQSLFPDHWEHKIFVQDICKLKNNLVNFWKRNNS